jgi:lysyl-tRNA synthetase class 1
MEEARKLLERTGAEPGRPVVFQTGFGPSGLPHIGTFAEVARTTFVRRAFEAQTGGTVATRLLAFSDDMDGLRSVPMSIPDPAAIEPHLGRPLSSIPDPFGTDESYSAHMNRRLREFLDRFGFDYEFLSSTACYQAGRFNEVLHRVGVHHDAIVDLVTRTMRPENRAGWSPFLPVCPGCGKNLTGAVIAVHPESDELDVECRDNRGLAGCGQAGRISYLDGAAKLRWKADWPLRWTALGVDYEMFGKDLNDTVSESRGICRILGGRPPNGMYYEMFLDADGSKISKSVGRGLSVDDWLRWAPLDSLLLFLAANPRKARRLHAEVVPPVVDELLDRLRKWEDLDDDQRAQSPVRFVYGEPGPPPYRATTTYGLARSLAAALGPHPDLLYRKLTEEDPAARDHEARVKELIEGAIAFEQEHAHDARGYQRPDNAEDRRLTEAFARWLEEHPHAEAAEIQSAVFEVARAQGRKPPELFRLLYRGLLGQDRGPRIGTFTLLLGRDEMIRRIRQLLAHTADGGRDP